VDVDLPEQAPRTYLKRQLQGGCTVDGTRRT